MVPGYRDDKMNVYMAAVYTNQYMRGQKKHDELTPREQEILNGLPYILESYHYVNKQRFVDEMRANNAKVFLDSGAFSAYTLGVTIDLPTYVDYIQRNIDIIREEDGIKMASVLDGIGDPLATYRNQLHMEYLGFRPLPCFHAGEDERYLEWYVANYEYITLGGMVGSRTEALIVWLDRIWDRYLVDGSGRPKVKVHGFGITAIPIMERYPWHSVDSSSWIQSASFGTIVHPKYGPLTVSEKAPSRHDAGQHVSTLSEIEREHVLRDLESQGFSYERLSTSYQSRVAYNLWAYGEINKQMNERKVARFEAKVQELF